MVVLVVAKPSHFLHAVIVIVIVIIDRGPTSELAGLGPARVSTGCPVAPRAFSDESGIRTHALSDQILSLVNGTHMSEVGPSATTGCPAVAGCEFA